jgi:hypothetical protein
MKVYNEHAKKFAKDLEAKQSELQDEVNDFEAAETEAVEEQVAVEPVSVAEEN